MDFTPDRPLRPARRSRLTPGEWRRVALAAVAPILLSLAALTPFAVFGPATASEVVVASVVYGGLLSLAAGFVAVDRLHARQCPACGRRNPRATSACPTCGYDLERRPRFACSERHEIHLAPGLCDCGRRLEELPVARGIGREVWWMLKAGAWLLVFLVGVGLVLQWTAR